MSACARVFAFSLPVVYTFKPSSLPRVIILKAKYTDMKIPGLSFSLKRALGITKAKQQIARATGIPTTKAGLERKIGNALLKTLFGK